MGWFYWGKKDEKPAPDASGEKPKKKICCACPDTKRARDECVTLHGPESDKCLPLIEAHKECLRAEGFKQLDAKQRLPNLRKLDIVSAVGQV